MSVMENPGQRSGSGVRLVLALETMLLLILIIFAAWAFNGRQQYKDDDSQLVATAVSAAQKRQQTADAATYTQQSLQPLATYTGPEALGTIIINYPKVWSAYIDDTGNGGAPIDAYFNPGVLPPFEASTSFYALRVEVLQTAYDNTITQFANSVKTGTATATAYALPKVPGSIGIMIKGAIGNMKTGELVALPVRQNTIELWTESPTYESDFNNIILPNFSFSP